MKTCPHCVATDVPGWASRCPHCGGRVRPSKAPAIIVAVIAVIIVGVVGVTELRRAKEMDSQRTQLRMEMEAMKRACSASTPEGFVEDTTAAFRQDLQASSLADDEQERLLDAWYNNLEVGDCANNGRRHAKPGMDPH